MTHTDSLLRGGFIGAFYALQKDLWGKSEELWEGCFSLVATALITVMGIAVRDSSNHTTMRANVL